MFKFVARGINFLLGKSLQNRHIIVSSSLEYLQRKRDLNKNYFDYIRLATLELISEEIRKKKLTGSVAELGVYKGKFARYINLYFKKRKLYLFDTFEGFDERDVNTEKKEGFSSGSQNFSDTSVESVLSLMPFPNNCIPVKGFFPESAANIKDEFIFVSLDADLYEPIYEGLKFFYPLLVPGGYIFVHDFNNDNYPGARKAVEKFCAEENISFVPIPDSAGSAIICK
ncbi:MAG: methyltransferase [Bacteroidota bacterium]|nr:methyltransferase [Bacteroidota bacterium]